MRAEPRIDEAMHAPTRLRLCAILRPVDTAEFSVLMELLGVSDANLSKTVRNLVEIGYLVTSKQASPARSDARRTTTVSLTPAGRAAYDGHVAALRRIIDA